MKHHPSSNYLESAINFFSVTNNEKVVVASTRHHIASADRSTGTISYYNKTKIVVDLHDALDHMEIHLRLSSKVRHQGIQFAIAKILANPVYVHHSLLAPFCF